MAAQTSDKKLDGAGLSVLWGLIKGIVPTVPTNVSDFTNDAAYVSLLDSHNANLVLASPNGTSGYPSFRSLVAADIPDLSGTYLPLSAGSTKPLTGDLYSEHDIIFSKCGFNQDKAFSIMRGDNSSYIYAGWNLNNRNGSGVAFRSTEYTVVSEQGSFSLYARDASNNSYLIGKPNGNLTWNGDEVATQPWAQNRGGYGTCSTNATTAAKTVSISNFVLTKNSIVSVYFEKGVDVVNATLNVSSTGAKYIHNMGVGLQPYVIRHRMTVTFLYDGTYWNIISLQGLEQSASGENYIDLGLPSGLKWARTNIDLSTASKFAASPYQNTCTFFSWGNNFGYNPVNGAFSNYTWNQTNYNTTGGRKLNGGVSPSFDAARANLGAPWRIPTKEEWKELYDNCDFLDASGNVISASTADKRISYNGYYGIRMRSKNNNAEIFFTCCGYGYDSSWSVNSGAYSQCRYWSASYKSGSEAHKMNANTNGVNFEASDNKFEGFPIRPVF